jgi:hypothetical protein
LDEGSARSIATTIIRPCGLLGYLVGRGSWWPSEARLKRGKRAVGQVMGSAYYLLVPVWQAFPSLDPGRVSDPFGLNARTNSLQDSPEDLRALLNDLETAAHEAVPMLEEHLPASHDHFRDALAELDGALHAAHEALRGSEP